MRIINSKEIEKNIKKLFLESNIALSSDINKALLDSVNKEVSPLGKEVLNLIGENLALAKKENMPICQDTGMAIVFVDIGNEVYIEGDLLEEAINNGVRSAYQEGYFRKSVVKDPIRRENTKDNTPAIIYYNIVKGDKIRLRVMPKGFGSENCGLVKMLKPAEGRDGVIDFVLHAVNEASNKPCPPIIVGVGVGGSMEKAALLAKEALFNNINEKNDDAFYGEMEEELLTKINKLGIGPAGLGGEITCIGVNILSYPTHIAGLPVAVNIACHVSRHKEITI